MKILRSKGNRHRNAYRKSMISRPVKAAILLFALQLCINHYFGGGSSTILSGNGRDLKQMLSLKRPQFAPRLALPLYSTNYMELSRQIQTLLKEGFDLKLPSNEPPTVHMKVLGPTPILLDPTTTPVKILEMII